MDLMEISYSKSLPGISTNGVAATTSPAPSPSSPPKAATFEEKLREKSAKKLLCPHDLRVFVKPDIGTAGAVGVGIHKDLFIIASSYFETLYNVAVTFNATSTDSLRLRLPDVTYSEFIFMRHFLYNSELVERISFPSRGIVVKLDMDMKLRLLQTSINCEVDLMMNALLKDIKTTMTKNDALRILQTSWDLSILELRAPSLKIIRENAEELLTTHLDDFSKLGHHNASSILADDRLECSETTVFNAALKWAEERSKYSKEPLQRKKSMQYYLSSLANCVRFPLMTVLEIYQINSKHNVLDPSDFTKIVLYISLPEEERRKMKERESDFRFTDRPRLRLSKVPSNYVLPYNAIDQPNSEAERNIMPAPPAPETSSIIQSPQRKRVRFSCEASSFCDTMSNTAQSSSASVSGTRRAESSNNCDGIEEDSNDDDCIVELNLVNLGTKPGMVFKSCDDMLLRAKPKNGSSTEHIETLRMTNSSIEKPYRERIFEKCKEVIIDFKYSYINSDEEQSTSKKQKHETVNREHFKNIIRNFDPMRFLIFRKTSTVFPLTSADIWGMRQNILLKIHGVTFLQTYHAPHEENDGVHVNSAIGDLLVLNYLRDSKLILSDEALRPKTLAISNCEFSAKLMKDKVKQLESLILYRVWGEFSMDDIMKDYSNLRELILWKLTPTHLFSSIGNSTLSSSSLMSSLLTPLCMNFSHTFSARNNLKKLVLFQVQLVFPTRCTHAAATLSELQLDRCHVSLAKGSRHAHIADVFHDFFPALERFYLSEDDDLSGRRNIQTNGNLASSELINCARKKISSLKWFKIMGLQWRGESEVEDLDKIEDQELKDFLRNVDVSPNSTNFLLEKGDKRNWIGTDYSELQTEDVEIDGGYHSEQDQLEYDWYHLSHFFDNCDVFEDFFINEQCFPELSLF